MNTLLTRTVRTAAATVVTVATAAAVTAAPASADPARITAGALSIARDSLPGWTFQEPDKDGVITAGVKL